LKGVDQVAPASLLVLVWTMFLKPSLRDQMAVRVLLGAATICGEEASCPAAERLTGVVHESTAHAGTVGEIATNPTTPVRMSATTMRRNTAMERLNDIGMSPLE
jgi:hypothetical protein